MVLKRLGKFCFFQMKPLFFYIILSIPIVFGASIFFLQYLNIFELEERFYSSCKKGKLILKRKQQKERFIQRYSHANPYFLDEQIESFIPLQAEQKQIETLIKHPALNDKRPLQGRIDFLKSSANRLNFVEEEMHSTTSMKETKEKQRHPVQMDAEDLKKILCLVEDIPIDSFPLCNGRPQIIITNFTLEKKQTPIDTNVFDVEMELLKREFIK